ncbi:histidinol-phosphate transaminase [Candidatus Omnitrophota bacterium]
MSSIKFKKCIKTLKPYAPGKPINEVKRELGLESIIKMASNENALGPSPCALKAMQKALTTMHYYPEGGCFYLKEKLASKLNVDESNVLFGNGSNEIIEFIVKGFLSEGGELLSSEYAFAVYPILTQAYGGKYVSVPMKDYRFDLEAIASAINKNTQIIFIANPNNPTGTMVTRDEWERFLSKVPKDVVVCLDEAYFEFVARDDYPNGIDYMDNGNVVILRTFSKLYGLAGLRIGYAISSKEIIDYFNRIRQPFNVNALAQCAARAALDDVEHIDKTIAMVQDGKKFLYAALDKMNIAYIPSETNFVLLEVPDSEEMFQEFLKQGIIVRGMKSYGLDKYIRVTIGAMEENEKFISLLGKILKVE